MRIEQLRSGMYCVYDSTNRIVLANVSKQMAMKYMDKRNKKGKNSDNKNRGK